VVLTKLVNSVAIVTGASRGIGRAIACALAREGAAVAVNYRTHADAAQQVVQVIRAEGGRATALAADVTNFAEVSMLVETVSRIWGPPDILVNNAGITKDGLLWEVDPEAWLPVLRTNLGGVINATKAVIPYFLERRGGVIVNVSSVMAERGWIGTSFYAASKGAINAFTRSAAVELARFGVRVNAVMPGFCPTDLVAVVVTEHPERIARQVPLRRLAQPDQIARVVTMLCSPEADYITGAVLPIDGGVGAQVGLGAPLRL